MNQTAESQSHYLPPLKLYMCSYKVSKNETTKLVTYTEIQSWTVSKPSVIIPLHFNVIKFLIWQKHENTAKDKPRKASIRSD